jgi:putative ABC transport system permease protein
LNHFVFILKTLWHYRRRHLTLALGMAIGMAVITGALVTGDSVRMGLQKLVGIRLGNVDLSVSAGDRYLTDSLAYRMSDDLGIPAAAVLQLDGSASADGGTKRLPQVQVFGIDSNFRKTLGANTFDPPSESNEAVISDHMAKRLGVVQGDEILIRINKPGPVPIDAPFVSNEDNIVTLPATIKVIAGKELHGRFHLQNTQTAPFNVFLSKKHLQKITGLDGLSNLILLAGNGKTSAIRVEKSLASNRTLLDAGLHLEKHPVTGEWILRTPRVFFDLPTLSAIEKVPSENTLWFSYFINEFRLGDLSTPYSFVSTLPGNQLQPGEILINRWLADDLKAKKGDSITLSYFLVGPLRSLTVENARFRVLEIMEMNDSRQDQLLMPEIPGLSDAGNCRDWETSIPIDLEKIRDKDEAYWNQQRGTPKAFINSAVAASMWQNRFGKYTQIRFPSNADPAGLATAILTHLQPSDIGTWVKEPASEGNVAASTALDFSGLFLGLSFFLIAGGIILSFLLIRLGLDGRISQVGTLRALGWPEGKIRKGLFLEIILVAVIGSIVGISLTILYTNAVFSALNGVWNSIVLTDTLEPVFKPGTLAIGFAISILISVLSIWQAIRRFYHREAIELLRRNQPVNKPTLRRVLGILNLVTGLLTLGTFVYGLVTIREVNPAYFFLSGTLLLISLMILATRLFRYHHQTGRGSFNLGSLSRSNLSRNSNRSLSVIYLFSIGMFMVIAIGANRKSIIIDSGTNINAAKQAKTGTGGFLFFMETTIAVPDNLNHPEVRASYGLDTPSEFVQMKKLEGDDASCLNLNRISNPPILSISEGTLDGRFTFASLADQKQLAEPWKILGEELPNGAIPAVADQTVIQWGLGLKTGDTLRYNNEQGDTINIVLMGGLANSVFQGNILISEKQFMKHWPSVSGTHVFLVSANRTDIEPIQSEFMRAFRDYGTDIKLADHKLAEFNAIENTYLSIFLVMGALAMLIGTIGLAVILARNLQERKAEIALLRATGFSRGRILKLIVTEYTVLLFYGTLAGGLSALAAVLPGLLNPAGKVSPLFLAGILLVLLGHGLFWIILLGWHAIRKPEIIGSLRTD